MESLKGCGVDGGIVSLPQDSGRLLDSSQQIGGPDAASDSLVSLKPGSKTSLPSSPSSHLNPTQAKYCKFFSKSPMKFNSRVVEIECQ